MNASLIIGSLLAAGGILALFIIESKLIGVIASGVGVFFIALSFYGDMQANKSATTSDFSAEKAEFNRDFARISGADKKTVDSLSKRADVLRGDADSAEAKRRKTVEDGEKARTPLLDALTGQVNAAAKHDAPKDSAMSN